jgi:hypothetical protein
MMPSDGSTWGWFTLPRTMFDNPKVKPGAYLTRQVKRRDRHRKRFMLQCAAMMASETSPQ